MPTKTTLLRELSKPLPRVVNLAQPGGNSTNSAWPDIGNWVVWEDFNAAKLRSQFSGIVEADWTIRDSLSPSLSRWDSQVFDEDDLEHSIIARCITPAVNAALTHALRCAQLNKTIDINLGRAGRSYEGPGADRRFKPDWALCSESHKTVSLNGLPRYNNLLPGDTKLSNKWRSSEVQLALSHQIHGASKKDPVRQVIDYCSQCGRQYGFIVTDAELVVLRVTPMATSTASSNTRQDSQPQVATHNRVSSTSTTLSAMSASLRGMSLVGTESSYQTTGYGSNDGYLVEYRAIPWDNSGPHKLTVQLGLFYLSWLAGVGQGALQFSYPGFDSCWPRLDGTFVYNTTGLAIITGVAVEHPQPDREKGPVWIELGDGQVAMTLYSACNLDVTESQGRPCYYYMAMLDAGEEAQPEPVLVTDAISVFDEESQQLRYFDSVVWKVGQPPAGPSRARAPPSPSQPLSSKRPRRK